MIDAVFFSNKRVMLLGCHHLGLKAKSEKIMVFWNFHGKNIIKQHLTKHAKSYKPVRKITPSAKWSPVKSEAPTECSN